MTETAEILQAKLDAQLANELKCLHAEIGDLLTCIVDHQPTTENADRLAVYDLELSNFMAELLRMKELVSSSRSAIAEQNNNIEG